MQWGNVCRIGVGTLCLALFATVGCRQRDTSPGHALGGPEVSGPVHQLDGVVLGKSAKLDEITVHQGVIPDFEPAMNAVYRVGDAGIFGRLKPGDKITAHVIPSETHIVYSLTNVAITSEPRGGAGENALPAHQLLMGEQVPEIPMTDQNGRTVDFGSFRGKAILITFIDSKCTDDCPIITHRFQQVNALLAADGKAFGATHLISISIDPANDTPHVLRKYGLGYLGGKPAGFSHWEFADLTPKNLKRLATAFGVVYYTQAGDIKHNMQTALIGKDGSLIQIWGGDQWNPAVLAKAVEAAAQTRNSGSAQRS